jgi:hypothetical protein
MTAARYARAMMSNSFFSSIESRGQIELDPENETGG